MRRKNDMLWKGMLEEVFGDLLRFIFPEADDLFDLKRGFEFLDKELSELYPEPDKRTDSRFVDKLVKVYRRDGKDEWFLVHVEVQGRKDRHFTERMFKYYYRIFDRYQRPVTAIAIFTGPDTCEMSGSYESEFLGTSVKYDYNTCRITDYSDEALAGSDNPFALVILAAKKALLAGKIPENELVLEKISIARLLLESRVFDRKKIEGILTFLHNYVLFEKQETNTIFMREIDQITGKTNTMGIIEQLATMKAEEAMGIGIEKGKENANRLVVINLLRDADFSAEKIASLVNVSVDFVKKVKLEVFSR